MDLRGVIFAQINSVNLMTKGEEEKEE